MKKQNDKHKNAKSIGEKLKTKGLMFFGAFFCVTEVKGLMFFVSFFFM